MTADGDRLAVHGGASGLQLPGVDPALLARDPLGIDASMRLTSAGRPLQFAVTHRLFSIRGRAITVGHRSATAAIVLPDLAPFAALVHQDVGGAARIGLTLAWEKAVTTIAADIQAERLAGSEPWLEPAGGRVSMRVAARLDDRDITISSMRATGRAWSLSLNADARRRAANTPAPGGRRGLGTYVASLNARWNLDILDLAAVSPSLAGSLTVSGGAQGPPDALSGSLLVGGTLEAAPLKMAVDWRREGDAGVFAIIRRADWKSVRLDGEATVRAPLSQSRGRFQLRVGDLADLDGVTGIEMHGGVSAGATFAPVGGRPQTQVQCAVRGMRIGRFVADAQISGGGPWDALSLRIAAQLPELPGGPAALSSTASLNLTTRALRITAAALDYRGQTARLLRPAVLSLADGVAVDDLRLGARDARFDLAGRIAPELDLRASLRDLTPALIDALAPGSLSGGKIEASAELHGQVGAPLGTVTFNATGLRAGTRCRSACPASTCAVRPNCTAHRRPSTRARAPARNRP